MTVADGPPAANKVSINPQPGKMPREAKGIKPAEGMAK